MVFPDRALGAEATKRHKIVPCACRTELPAKIALKTHLGMDSGSVWRSLGRHLAGLSALLGAPGRSWALLGQLLNTSWALLAVSGLLCGASGSHLGSQTRPRPRFSWGWGRPRLSFETLSAALLTCFLLRLSFRHIVPLKMQ